MSDSVFFKDKDIIPTELPVLNIAFSGDLDGGMASGLTVLAGKPASFKTLLGLFCVKAFLDKYKDSVCIFYDSEGGATPKYLLDNGIDPERIVHIPIEHIEMLKFDMVKTLKELDRKDKVIMMIDSIGNTASLKELEDAENEKSVAEMQRAKSLKALFRMITPSLIAKDIPCIAIAHSYDTLEIYSKQVISGGQGIIYAANQAFIISKSQEKDGDELAGWKFTINVEKSRYVKQKSKLSFTVLYNKGIQKWSALFDLALESGNLIKPKNGWYQTVDLATGEISEKSYRAKDIQNNDEFFEKLIVTPSFKEFISNKFKLSGSIMASQEEDSDDDFVDISEEE